MHTRGGNFMRKYRKNSRSTYIVYNKKRCDFKRGYSLQTHDKACTSFRDVIILFWRHDTGWEGAGSTCECDTRVKLGCPVAVCQLSRLSSSHEEDLLQANNNQSIGKSAELRLSLFFFRPLLSFCFFPSHLLIPTANRSLQLCCEFVAASAERLMVPIWRMQFVWIAPCLCLKLIK